MKIHARVIQFFCFVCLFVLIFFKWGGEEMGGGGGGGGGSTCVFRLVDV